jgi:hypothetical protein
MIKSLLTILSVVALIVGAYMFGMADGVRHAKVNLLPISSRNAQIDILKQFHIWCATETPIQFAYPQQSPDRDVYICLTTGPVEEPKPEQSTPQMPWLENRNQKI